jgi:hypothetical protein
MAMERGDIDDAFWVCPPDHLSYFNVSSLVNIAAATGWECKEIITDFPVDWFLYHPGSNYVKNKTLGKNAYFANIRLTNAIHLQPIDDVFHYWASAARVGMGRAITAFLKPCL